MKNVSKLFSKNTKIKIGKSFTTVALVMTTETDIRLSTIGTPYISKRYYAVKYYYKKDH